MTSSEKEILENVLAKRGCLEIEELLIQDLLNVVQEETFGNKVARALNYKKQGQFDKAMLHMSDVNRDQVLSIRAIQSIIDKIKDVSKTAVIFEKYRQFYPFQIGLTNGKFVLDLLTLIRLESNVDLNELVADLHDNEKLVDSMLEELHFYTTRMKGRISANEINQLKKNIETNTEAIFKVKMSLIECICGVVQARYFQILIEDRVSLIKNLYLILSSSIETLDASLVDVEENT